MWTYTRQIDHPEIYGWEPWDERFVLKTRGFALFANSAVERAFSRAMDFMGSYGYAREYDIEKHWREQKVLGPRMGGKALKTLENARYWYDLETLWQGTLRTTMAVHVHRSVQLTKGTGACKMSSVDRSAVMARGKGGVPMR